jgi:hypothetical protein
MHAYITTHIHTIKNIVTYMHTVLHTSIRFGSSKHAYNQQTDLGRATGWREGLLEGHRDGYDDGRLVGIPDGRLLGLRDGCIDGCEVGADVGLM